MQENLSLLGYLYVLINYFILIGERNSGLSQLRDIILNNLADQLQKNRFGSEDDDHYR